MKKLGTFWGFPVLVLFAARIYGAESAHTSLFNAQWLKATVSIDQQISANPELYHHAGTGFLVLSPHSRLILITAQHVVADDVARKNFIYRVATDNGTASVREVQLENAGLGDWFLSRSADVACRFIAFPIPEGKSAISAIPVDAFLSPGELEPGAPLFILGFPPYGESKARMTRPLVRHGIFAGVDEDGNQIADAFVFPGNSGAPIGYAPPFKVSAPLQSPVINSEKLVGLVRGYAHLQAKVSAYVETKVEENSGLAVFVPASDLQQLLGREDVINFDSAILKK